MITSDGPFSRARRNNLGGRGRKKVQLPISVAMKTKTRMENKRCFIKGPTRENANCSDRKNIQHAQQVGIQRLTVLHRFCKRSEDNIFVDDAHHHILLTFEQRFYGCKAHVAAVDTIHGRRISPALDMSKHHYTRIVIRQMTFYLLCDLEGASRFITFRNDDDLG